MSSGLKRKAPIPGGPAAPRILATAMQSPIQNLVSGEITGSDNGQPLGVASVPGKITGAWLALDEKGNDNTNVLSMELDITVGGTSIFSTKPKITAISGETGAASTFASGEKIVQGVIDPDNNSVSEGQVLIRDLTVTRTASPEKEMANAAVVVDFEPEVPGPR